MSYIPKTAHELECQEKIQALQEQVRIAQNDIAQMEKEIAEAATLRILDINPFRQVYRNLKRKKGECYSILSSAILYTDAHGKESICLRGVDIISDSGIFLIEETCEEVYDLDNFNNIFKFLENEEYVQFATKYRWLFVPIEKFLMDFKHRT